MSLFWQRPDIRDQISEKRHVPCAIGIMRSGSGDVISDAGFQGRGHTILGQAVDGRVWSRKGIIPNLICFGMVGHVAIVETGPTGIYTFRYLPGWMASQPSPCLDREIRTGIGMPYSPGTASRSMLANIASIEISPVVTTYLDWMKGMPAAQ